MRPVLDVVHLRKQYGDILAVGDVSLSVMPGEIVGLLGPNGAGKTTTFSMVLGVLEQTSGSISVDGFDLSTQRTQALEKTNFAAVYAALPGNMTVEQNLYIFGLLYMVPNLKDRIHEVLAEFELEHFRHTKCGLLSSGEQTRVGIAKALLSRPRLLLLDEPTASLDPVSAQKVRSLICSYARTHASGVLWTSHNMQEVTDVCDRVLFLSHGKILLEGDPKTLPQEHGKQSLEELFITVAHEPLTVTQI